MCSVAGQGDPVVWVFSTSGFHRFLATKPVSSETSKAETVVKFGRGRKSLKLLAGFSRFS
jgi:hypothetical protein